VNVNTEEIYQTNFSIKNGIITYVGKENKGVKEKDLNGKFVCPGFIDAHVHIESSLVNLTRFAEAVIPRGTTSVVADPHEIANVLGIEGIKMVMDESKSLPLRFFFTIPPCCPATKLGTSGCAVSLTDIRKALFWENVVGLAEVMDYHGVLKKDKLLLSKIKCARGRIIDGHAPGLRGEELNEYILAGMSSDHECIRYREGVEKIRLGMKVLLCEGSTKKIDKFVRLLNLYPSGNFMFATDDKQINEIISNGHMDFALRKAIKLGADPIKVIKMSTLNTAKHYGIERLGFIAPGKLADFLIIKDIDKLDIEEVYINGKCVAKNGKILVKFKPPKYPKNVLNSVHLNLIKKNMIKIESKKDKINVIKVREGYLTTTKRIAKAKVENGFLSSDIEKDILKACVIERHRKTGEIGIGFVSGFGLKRGAIGTTYAHDCHNIVALGTNDNDIVYAVNILIKAQGGMVVVENKKTKALLKLPIAGLMSNLSIPKVLDKIEKLKEATKELGCKMREPFATLSFLSLEVLPKIRLTNKGLVDVDKLKIIGLVV
ncbi:MAG: adenine deaminase, partial [Candidatus Thermoplasmatota archaeon]